MSGPILAEAKRLMKVESFADLDDGTPLADRPYDAQYGAQQLAYVKQRCKDMQMTNKKIAEERDLLAAAMAKRLELLEYIRETLWRDVAVLIKDDYKRNQYMQHFFSMFDLSKLEGISESLSSPRSGEFGEISDKDREKKTKREIARIEHEFSKRLQDKDQKLAKMSLAVAEAQEQAKNAVGETQQLRARTEELDEKLQQRTNELNMAMADGGYMKKDIADLKDRLEERKRYINEQEKSWERKERNLNARLKALEDDHSLLEDRLAGLRDLAEEGLKYSAQMEANGTTNTNNYSFAADAFHGLLARQVPHFTDPSCMSISLVLKLMMRDNRNALGVHKALMGNTQKDAQAEKHATKIVEKCMEYIERLTDDTRTALNACLSDSNGEGGYATNSMIDAAKGTSEDCRRLVDMLPTSASRGLAIAMLGTLDETLEVLKQHVAGFSRRNSLSMRRPKANRNDAEQHLNALNEITERIRDADDHDSKLQLLRKAVTQVQNMYKSTNNRSVEPTATDFATLASILLDEFGMMENSLLQIIAAGEDEDIRMQQSARQENPADEDSDEPKVELRLVNALPEIAPEVEAIIRTLRDQQRNSNNLEPGSEEWQATRARIKDDVNKCRRALEAASTVDSLKEVPSASSKSGSSQPVTPATSMQVPSGSKFENGSITRRGSSASLSADAEAAGVQQELVAARAQFMDLLSTLVDAVDAEVCRRIPEPRVIQVAPATKTKKATEKKGAAEATAAETEKTTEGASEEEGKQAEAKQKKGTGGAGEKNAAGASAKAPKKVVEKSGGGLTAATSKPPKSPASAASPSPTPSRPASSESHSPATGVKVVVPSNAPTPTRTKPHRSRKFAVDVGSVAAIPKSGAARRKVETCDSNLQCDLDEELGYLDDGDETIDGPHTEGIEVPGMEVQAGGIAVVRGVRHQSESEHERSAQQTPLQSPVVDNMGEVVDLLELNSDKSSDQVVETEDTACQCTLIGDVARLCDATMQTEAERRIEFTSTQINTEEAWPEATVVKVTRLEGFDKGVQACIEQPSSIPPVFTDTVTAKPLSRPGSGKLSKAQPERTLATGSTTSAPPLRSSNALARQPGISAYVKEVPKRAIDDSMFVGASDKSTGAKGGARSPSPRHMRNLVDKARDSGDSDDDKRSPARAQMGLTTPPMSPTSRTGSPEMSPVQLTLQDSDAEQNDFGPRGSFSQKLRHSGAGGHQTGSSKGSTSGGVVPVSVAVREKLTVNATELFLNGAGRQPKKEHEPPSLHFSGFHGLDGLPAVPPIPNQTDQSLALIYGSDDDDASRGRRRSKRAVVTGKTPALQQMTAVRLKQHEDQERGRACGVDGSVSPRSGVRNAGRRGSPQSSPERMLIEGHSPRREGGIVTAVGGVDAWLERDPYFPLSNPPRGPSGPERNRKITKRRQEIDAVYDYIQKNVDSRFGKARPNSAPILTSTPENPNVLSIAEGLFEKEVLKSSSSGLLDSVDGTAAKTTKLQIAQTRIGAVSGSKKLASAKPGSNNKNAVAARAVKQSLKRRPQSAGVTNPVTRTIRAMEEAKAFTLTGPAGELGIVHMPQNLQDRLDLDISLDV